MTMKIYEINVVKYCIACDDISSTSCERHCCVDKHIQTRQHETLPPATAMQRNPRHNKPKPTCGAAHRCHLCPPPVSELETSLMILLCRRHRLEDAVGKPGICRHGRQGIRCCLRGSRHHRGDGGAESERDEGSLEHHRCLHNSAVSGPLSESNGRRAKLCRCSLHLTRTLTRGFLRAPRHAPKM